jgi:hypothetical protein
LVVVGGGGGESEENFIGEINSNWL